MIFLLSPPHIILPQLLYAETHYSFRGIYSRLKKNEPEVLADVPHRLNPGHSLPVLLLIKDAHRYPVAVGRIEVSIDSPSGYRQREYFDLKNRRVRDHWWHTILPCAT